MAEWALLAALVLVAGQGFAQSSRPDVSLEYAVKATYLYKLAPFVDWPSGTFASPEAPFEICVIGPDPFHDFLEKEIAGRRMGTHPFAIRRLSDAASDDHCQIAFIGKMRARKVRESLLAFEGKPVLTVTDSDAPGSDGSIVQFVIRDGHVRFVVDNAAAERNHLAISSKLLSLAVSVKGED